LLSDRYNFESRKRYLQEPEGWSTELWSQYAELGLLGLPFAEEYGGFGGGPVEVMLVMQAFGRAIALEPYLSTVVLGGTAIKLAGSDAHKSDILPQIGEGKLKLAFAHGESADKLIVSARTAGEREDPYGITLFLVDAKANGVARRGYTMRD